MSGMSTSRASLKKKGRLFLREHGDCFLHVTRGWLSYWPVSHSSVSRASSCVRVQIKHVRACPINMRKLACTCELTAACMQNGLKLDYRLFKQQDAR